MSKVCARDFYDKIADKYSWSFPSRNDTMNSQISKIVPFLERFNVKTILDCSCGGGMQAIPLAKHGHQVDAGDISANMVRKAVEFAKQDDVEIDFRQSDFRFLENSSPKTYDCVLT